MTKKTKKSSAIDIRLIGDNAMKLPYVNNNTSGRLVMHASHDKQTPIISNPEDRIVGTGYAAQQVDFTYDIVVDNDSVFINTVYRYTGEDQWSSVIVFVHDRVLNILTHYEIPKYRSMGEFGLAYTIDTDYIDSLTPRDIIPAKTRLGHSNNTKGNTYKVGRNLNAFIGSLPETGEDCMLVCKDVIDDYKIVILDEYRVSYGKSAILADIHGNDTIGYKALPNVGDYIGPDEVLYSKIDLDLKKLKAGDWDIIDNAMAFTKKGLRTRRPHYVNNTLLKYGGTVVDIEIHQNSKTGDVVENTAQTQQAHTLISYAKSYYTMIIKIYNDYIRTYGSEDAANETSSLIVDALLYLETPIKNRIPTITKLRKKTKLDLYTIKIIVARELTPRPGYKISCSYGGLINLCA